MDIDRIDSPVSSANTSEGIACPDCGNEKVVTEMRTDKFIYGDGPKAVVLTTSVPVRKCSRCGLEYTDECAEQARHDAVCSHLQVMTPQQLRSLRQMHGYSVSEFAAITRLGEASIVRWENGTIIQNAAYDDYLYLLGWSENIERLRHRRKAPEQPPHASKQPTFRAIDAHSRREEAKSFSLHPQHTQAVGL